MKPLPYSYPLNSSCNQLLQAASHGSMTVHCTFNFGNVMCTLKHKKLYNATVVINFYVHSKSWQRNVINLSIVSMQIFTPLVGSSVICHMMLQSFCHILDITQTSGIKRKLMPSAGFLITTFDEVPPELFKELMMSFPSKFCAYT